MALEQLTAILWSTLSVRTTRPMKRFTNGLQTKSARKRNSRGSGGLGGLGGLGAKLSSMIVCKDNLQADLPAKEARNLQKHFSLTDGREEVTCKSEERAEIYRAACKDGPQTERSESGIRLQTERPTDLQ